ncbi:BCCT family transporter [Alkalicoccobacillus porphyridii]|uniref:BCCT family transporter n=1 Tax=Alkalicoccobacillus porphyridii TaxID=2597270 RepID=A0A553ZZ47_9BACI|nr:BCCT family transporter [Alkalicoccobacillus porphyridii]TSB46685.1 BCCT family transporter [Alkalicoccobacillus porphyridii]
MSTENQGSNHSKSVLYISTTVMGLLIFWGAFFPGVLASASGVALDWVIETFGWFYMLLLSAFVLIGLGLAVSPFGKIKLGKNEDEPEHSWLSWVGMLFASGLGVGFVFFGVAEPLLYYLDTPVGLQPETVQSAEAGLRYGVFHWGLHAWGAFSIVGLTLAYVQYRKNRPALISSAFYPLLGNRVNGWIGRMIDILAVIATCAGVATTFGLSALQISGGLSYVTALPNNIYVQLVVIAVVTILFIFSAVKGINKGIKRLSNINLVIAGFLLLFVLFTGPTLFILENFVSTLGGYVSSIVSMSLTMTPFSESEWLGTNTIFFWAWHMSWSPFIGLFIARISKGRTVREFMAGVLLVPTILAVIWFTTFGGSGLYFEMYGNAGLASIVADEVEVAMFVLLEQLPLTALISGIAIILVLIFFVTSADSAAFVLGSMTSGGNLNPGFKLKVLWGALIAGTAAVLLISGEGGLDALQTAALTAALPFAFILIFMIIAVFIMMGRDHAYEKRKRRTQQLEYIKSEVKDDLRDDLYEELKEEVYEEVKQEIQEEQKSNESNEDKP